MKFTLRHGQIFVDGLMNQMESIKMFYITNFYSTFYVK